MVDAEPLVLLPGMNCSPRLWRDVAPPGSLLLHLEETTIELEVVRLLDELPDRFALAGLSLGGIVAMALVRTAPERVTRLCLMSTNPYAPTDAQHRGWADTRDQLAAGRTARDIQSDLLPVLLSTRPGPQPGAVDTTLDMADEVGAERLDRQLQMQSTRIDETAFLARIACPTLLIAARDDALCSVAQHEDVQRLVPGAQLVVVERCAHLSPLEQPAKVAEAWSGWLG